MPRTRSPRKSSLQYWPRKRARDIVARVRGWAESKDAKILGFAGYKVGMTHIIVNDSRPNSITKGMEISWPVTIVECPPLKIAGITFYKNQGYGVQKATTIMAENLDKELSRTTPLPKKINNKIDDIKFDDYVDIRVLAYTQPKLTSIGKKKPEIFELSIGGLLKDKLDYAKNNLGKEIKVEDIFKEGQQVDIHAVTKGKGYQGPVKRFGVAIRHHKSEKTKRGPGSLGPWHGRRMWRVSHAGQMGFHNRLMFNNWLLKIDKDSSKVNPLGGFLRYGFVKNSYLLIKGSVPGPSKRIIKLTQPTRLNKKIPSQSPKITYISTESKQ